MPIFIYSALFLLIILLIKLLFDRKRNCGFRILAIFGIIIGLSLLGLNHLFNKAFGASTPVNIRTENLTGENLKIYSIKFWDNTWNGKRNFVNYDTELKPNEKSNDFWFENDGTTEFWVVAKNNNNEIEYLNIVTENDREFVFKIRENQNIDLQEKQIAQQLTMKEDKEEQIKSYAIWANIILIGLLTISLVDIKTGGNKA